MTTRARIGITTYARAPKIGFSLPAEYVDAVRRAGAIPLLLPPGEPSVDSWLEIVDGIVLAGGGDLDPRLYRGNHHEEIYMVDEERDRSELELAGRILDRRVPTLGICRGTQVLNVVLGGTLHEHLPDVVGEQVLHRVPPREPTPHTIRVSANSLLARTLGRLELEASSWHHQSIKEMAPGLEGVAHAADGVIEAVEMRDHPFMLGVQWHPELTASADPVQQRLFDALIEAASRYRPRASSSPPKGDVEP